MTKIKMKKLAALAISLVMASGAAGIVGYAGKANSATAFADTAHYAVADESSIGVGIVASNVEVTNTKPAVLALEDVAAGSYIISVNITEEDAYTSYDIYAKVGNGEEVKLIFSWYTFSYVGTVNVPDGATTLTLSVKSNVADDTSDIKLIVMAELDTLTLHNGMTLSGVGVEYGKPATIDVSDITPGTYVLNVITEDVNYEMNDEGEITPVSLYASLDGKSAELTYTPGAGAYTTVITVDSNSSALTIATSNNNSYVLAIRLVDFVISPDNGYTLGGAVISNNNPASIKLMNVEASDYTVAVDLGETLLPAGATIKAKVDNGEEVTLTKDDNYYSAYTGTITVGANATTLTISTTSATALTVTVSMVAQAPLYAMETEQTLGLYRVVNFEYKAPAEGYYKIASKSYDVETKAELNATYDIALKTEIDTFDSTAIHGDNFPVWLEANQTYYFEVMYTGLMPENDEWVMAPDYVNVTFIVSSWTATTPIMENEYVYVPVTPVGEATQEIAIDSSVTAGTYALTLSEVPWFFGMMGNTIYAHYNNGDPIALNMSNGYVANINITADARTIYFTTNSGERLSVGVMLTEPVVVVDDTIVLNEAEDITVAAGETAVYFVEKLGGGAYTITLNLPSNALIQVEASTSDDVIIEAGKAVGEFNVILPADAESTTVALFFTNMGDEEVSFKATVTPNNIAQQYDITSVTMMGNTSVSYYVNLEAGTHYIDLSDTTAIQVMVNGQVVIEYGATFGEFTVTEDSLVMITFMYVGAEEESVTFGAFIS